MMNEATEEKLKTMKLTGMLSAWNEQRATPKSDELGFDERFGLIVDAEELYRETRRLGRTLKQAKLKATTACVEGIEYAAKRDLDRAVIRQIATCRWVAETQNIAITGATGTGKTYLACAFAHQACRKGYRALYRRLPALLQELRLARADGTHARVMVRLARVNVLVVDDFGIAPLNDFDRQDLLELIDDRYDAGSLIISGQLPPERWHEYIDDPTLADAICDRLLHRIHKLNLSGPSRRKAKAPKN